MVVGALSRLGFDVIEKHDLGVDQMRGVLTEFEDKAAGTEWAVVYFSGHGMELNGKNWLPMPRLPAPASSQTRLLRRSACWNVCLG